LLLIFFLALHSPTWAAASKKITKKSKLQDTHFIIEKERKNVLPTTARLFAKAAPPPKGTKLTPPTYDLKIIAPYPAPIPHKLRLLRAQSDTLAKLYGSYIKLGICSNPLTPYFSCLFDSKRSTRYTCGFHLQPLPCTEGSYTLYGKAFTPHIILGADLQYNKNVHPYKQPPSANQPLSKDYNRILHEGDLHVSLKK